MSRQTKMLKSMGFNPPPKPETQYDRCVKCEHGLVEPDIAYCTSQDLALEVEDGEMIMANGGFPIECEGKEWKHKSA